MTSLSESDLDDLQFSPEYAEYIMDNAGSDRIVCNGDSLLQLQEDGYLFEEFLATLNLCTE